jgi:hypothetical protein
VAKFAGVNQVVGDRAQLAVRLHRRPDQQLERLVGGQLVALHEDAFGLVDNPPRLLRGLEVVGPVPGGPVGVQVAGGDRGIGAEPGPRAPAVLVEGVRLAGVDVQRAGDLLVLVDGQRDGQGAAGTVLGRPGQVVRPPGIGAGVGDLGQLAGAGDVQARAVAAFVLSRMMNARRRGSGKRAVTARPRWSKAVAAGADLMPPPRRP